MVQALDNGGLDVISPQPTVHTLRQLQALGDKATIYDGDTLPWEHLDLRRAFAMCVPCQQIVHNMIKPINPDAQVMSAREVFPFESDYRKVVDSAYDEVDVDRARTIVEAQVLPAPKSTSATRPPTRAAPKR